MLFQRAIEMVFKAYSYLIALLEIIQGDNYILRVCYNYGLAS